MGKSAKDRQGNVAREEARCDPKSQSYFTDQYVSSGWNMRPWEQRMEGKGRACGAPLRTDWALQLETRKLRVPRVAQGDSPMRMWPLTAY